VAVVPEGPPASVEDERIHRGLVEFRDPRLESEFLHHQLDRRAEGLQRSMYAASAAVLTVTAPRLVVAGLTTTAVVLSSLSLALAVAGVIYGGRVGRDPALSINFVPLTVLAAWGMAMAVVGPLVPGAPAAACHLVVCGLVFGELLFLPNRLVYTATVTATGVVAYFVLSWTVFPSHHAVDPQSAVVMSVLVVVAWMTAGEMARTRRTEFLVFRQERRMNERLSEEITSRQEIQAELSWLADHDTLTDLLTRRAFFEQAEHLMATARRKGHPLTVLVIDADNFKSVNDRFGHHTGDEVLRRMARAVKTYVRADDVVGRLGGEEFSVVMGGADLTLARATAEQLRRHIADTVIDHPDGDVRTTVSIGIAQADGWSESLHDVLQRADAAMYRAKDEGRDRTAPAAARAIVTPA
jgi:diguanylate cyclase (GGDEF)-like protein